MKRKQIIDFITSVILIVTGSIILTFPFFREINVKYIFIAVLAFYGIINLIEFILTSKEKDFEGLLTMIASIISLVLLGFLEVENNMLNLPLTLFSWLVLMSLIKLKKCDGYRESYRTIWIFRIVTLILFILVGLLTVINLYYSAETQLLVLGFYYFIHGVLELVDPITNYLLKK